MFGLSPTESIVVIVGVLTIIQFIMNIVKSNRKPNEEQDKRLIKLEDGCAYKHKTIDEKIAEISGTLKLIQENHLRHIEDNVNKLFRGQDKLFTMLDERLPKK